jgi:hypothetical protein
MFEKTIAMRRIAREKDPRVQREVAHVILR